MNFKKNFKYWFSIFWREKSNRFWNWRQKKILIKIRILEIIKCRNSLLRLLYGLLKNIKQWKKKWSLNYMNKYFLKHMPIKLTYFQLSEQNFVKNFKKCFTFLIIRLFYFMKRNNYYFFFIILYLLYFIIYTIILYYFYHRIFLLESTVHAYLTILIEMKRGLAQSAWNRRQDGASAWKYKEGWRGGWIARLSRISREARYVSIKFLIYIRNRAKVYTKPSRKAQRRGILSRGLTT